MGWGFFLRGAASDRRRSTGVAALASAPMKLLPLMPPLICLALSACASPGWVNPQNPAADLNADTAACDKDAERVGRISQLSDPMAGSSCITGPSCVGAAETRRLQVEAAAFAAQRRCLQARGWRQPG